VPDPWVGKDESGGIPIEPLPGAEPPDGWRLEAIAATERPRSLTLGADGRTAVYIHDRDTSDVWLLDLEDGTPQRLTTGRDPMPYWEDTEPRLSPDGSTVAYVDGDHVCVVPTAGGPPRQLVEGWDPVWIDDGRLIVGVERERASRLVVVDVAEPWPRLLAANELGDEEAPAVSPDRTEVVYEFRPRDDLKRYELRVTSLETGETRALTGTPGMRDGEPAWSPDGETIAYASERPGWTELHVVGRDGSGDRQLTDDGGDFSEFRWHPDGSRLVAIRGRRGHYDLVTVDAGAGAVETLAPGGVWGCPAWTASGDVVAAFHDHATPPELRLVDAGGARSLLAPAPAAVKRAPFVSPEEVTFRSFDGLEIPAFLFRPPGASAERPAPAVVYPHGGPTDAYGDEWDGHAQYFIAKGYAWICPNFRGSTSYGRDFERANHGVWGVDDTKDCLAAADFLRTLDWVDGDRLAIFGASYGSYMALLSVTDDPQHRFRCAVCKYGDCDLVTSWAQGDRLGVQDLERMMGTPAEHPEAYLAASPVHRLENVQVPILVAHGEKDERVSPKQSEELVAALERLGKTYEYVTYPTEAHGLLRVGPQLHYYRRLERFLDWYLL
jgi:dipeptidyl aminopeptidase/acylaminoacyl peptidase